MQSTSFPNLVGRSGSAPLLFLFLLATSLASVARADPDAVKERINAAVGRALFVEEADIPGKVHSWKDVKKWFAPRGKDPLRMAYPEKLKGSGHSETIVVRVILTPEGLAINPQVEEIKNKALMLPAVLHVAAMKFQVPKLEGTPIYLQQKVKLLCSEDPTYGAK